MAINNYRFARWYGVGNEDSLDTWNKGYTPNAMPALDAEVEAKAKAEQDHPREVRIGTKEEIEAIWKEK